MAVKKIIDALGEEFSEINFEEAPRLEGQPAFDIAIPCFIFAKKLKQAPQKIAQTISEKLSELGFEKIETIGGFVNIRLSASELSKELLVRRSDPLVNSRHALESEKIVIDFSSPNIAKPFSVGHIRSTNIGAAISRIYSAVGAEVVRVNHLGDWGTQFGKLITAYKRFGNADFVKGDPINNLYKLYVQFHEEEKKDPALIDEAREWFVRLEKGDEEAKELWSWFRDVSYYEFKKTYDRLGVAFDYVTGESFYNELMKDSIQELESKSLLKESEGAMVVDLEEYQMPPCLIKKTDGSTLYATRDIATAQYRMKTYQPTQLVYVVGSEQKLHFRQVFKVIELMGHGWAKNYKHVDFGLIKFGDEKMSTRKGNIILLEEVLDRAEEEAEKIILEKDQQKEESKRLSDAERADVAEKVGVGAVIFFDLKAKRTKDVHFSWKDILSFDGDSGPYLQYTYVRIESVLERARKEGYQFSDSDSPTLSTEEERELAKRIISFPAAVEAAAREYEPSLIAHELLDLAAAFNRFYMNVRVIKEGDSEIAGRLQLLNICQKVLETGLGLFGISCPKRM